MSLQTNAHPAQIKDAVTASMKQWLLEIRNISTEVGRIAFEAMESRTRRWRSKREKDLLLRTSRVGSAVELITYEKTECKLMCSVLVAVLTWRSQLMSLTMINCTSTLSLYSSAFTSIPPWNL